MHKLSLFIFFLSILFFSFSCTEKVEMDIPESESEIVVYSTITPFKTPYPQPVKVKVKKTIPISDTLTNTIEDATVLYYENDNLLDTLRYDSSSKSYTNYNMDNLPSPGNNYSLKVVHGGKELTGHTIIPDKVNITDTNLIPGKSSRVSVEFQDPAETDNYYEVLVTNECDFNDSDDNIYRVSSDDNIITSESYYPSMMQFEAQDPKYLLFSDKTIDGEKYTLNVNYTPPIENIQDSLFISDHYIIVHLRNVTKEYYQFKTSFLQAGYHAQEDPLFGMSEPINVMSNINNGIGLFGGYNVDIKRFHIDRQEVSE